MTITVHSPEPLGYPRPKEVADKASDITSAGYTLHRVAGATSRVIFEIRDADGQVRAEAFGKLEHNEHDVLDRLILSFDLPKRAPS